MTDLITIWESCTEMGTIRALYAASDAGDMEAFKREMATLETLVHTMSSRLHEDCATANLPICDQCAELGCAAIVGSAVCTLVSGDEPVATVLADMADIAWIDVLQRRQNRKDKEA